VERVFLLLKPDGVPREAEIMAILSAGVSVAASRVFAEAPLDRIESLYAEHRGKPFYEPLIASFRGRPVKAFLLAAKDGTPSGNLHDLVAALVGETDPKKAAPGTVRALSPDSMEVSMREKRTVRNLVHRSRTAEDSLREGAIFFDREDASMTGEPILKVDIEGVPLVRRGKVRDVFDLGEHLLVVATDRISAFDVVMPNGIPRKGEVLTAMSVFWFGLTAGLVPNHLVTVDVGEMERLTGRTLPRGLLSGRAMLVRKARVYPMECIVRGYLAGSGWKEYREKGTLAGFPLPSGLRESERLPEPLFTPSTKADEGHDMNLTVDEAKALVGEDVFRCIRPPPLMPRGGASSSPTPSSNSVWPRRRPFSSTRF
jgi:nucleoside diphosphate kinase